MWMRSPGLGKTELKGHIESLERKGGTLIAHLKITEPVKWHVRAAMDFKDLKKITKLIFKSIFCGSIPYVLLRGTNDRDKLDEF